MAMKSQVFCLRFNSKTKQKPATKIQNHVFLLQWGAHAKVRLIRSGREGGAAKIVTYPLL